MDICTVISASVPAGSTDPSAQDLGNGEHLVPTDLVLRGDDNWVSRRDCAAIVFMK
jgi:hypothetical protein